MPGYNSQRRGTSRTKTGHGPHKDGARPTQRQGTARTKTGHGPHSSQLGDNFLRG